MKNIFKSEEYKKDETGRFKWKKSVPVKDHITELYEYVKTKNPGETEYLQAVCEVLFSLESVFEKYPHYIGVMKQILEPERVIMFRVAWTDDNGIQQINRGYRIQYSSALGPYKGGLRFHPTVNFSILKFLAFEQIFKNSLTGLGIGGAKGGSDFDPKGRSDGEIMRFCQSFMTAFYSFIGDKIDVPAGDINVGSREICYLLGQYKRLTHSCEGTLTGKSIVSGGSHIRPEATGYGAVYFLSCWTADQGISLKNTKCVVSGSGNVAQYAVEKLIQLEALPITMSDSSGYILEPNGFTKEQLMIIFDIKNKKRGRISDYCQYSKTAKYFANKKPWEVSEYAFAFPCATQNEINEDEAQQIKKAGCKAVVEGANMPTTMEAIHFFKKNGITLCPSKAANAGGVVVSGLEMAQNESRAQWTREEVDSKLQSIMKSIYQKCKDASNEFNHENDLVVGANIAGFLNVAKATYEQGCI